MFGRVRKRRAATDAVREAALTEIMRTWSVDEADVTPTELGFDWLPGSHLVHVRIHQDERKLTGPVRFRITITTEYRRSVPVHDMRFILKAGFLASVSSPTYSQVYPPSELVEKYFDGRPAHMDMFASAYVYDEVVKWTSGFLARMSIMQPINAELLARVSEPGPWGTPALANGSLRATVNGVLNVYDDLIVLGEKPSRWTGSEEFEAYIQERGNGFANERGMVFEMPLGSDTALVRFHADQSDRQLGNGLTIETQILRPSSFSKICDLAAWLNYFESILWTDFPQLGRWHPLAISETQTNLAHTSFIPNAYFIHGLVVNYAIWAIARVRWAQEMLPNET